MAIQMINGSDYLEKTLLYGGFSSSKEVPAHSPEASGRVAASKDSQETGAAGRFANTRQPGQLRRITLPGQKSPEEIRGMMQQTVSEESPQEAGGSPAFNDPHSRVFAKTDEAEENEFLPEDEKKKPGKRSSPEECETCKERKYQDGSDENVSFKSARHISPESAASAVRGHEQEHVSNAYTKAAEKGGKVVNASVTLHTATCPECGRVYVAGGVTHTTIKYPNEDNPYQQDRKAQDGMNYAGLNVNFAG